jgi:hypothetical protein
MNAKFRVFGMLETGGLCRDDPNYAEVRASGARLGVLSLLSRC